MNRSGQVKWRLLVVLMVILCFAGAAAAEGKEKAEVRCYWLRQLQPAGTLFYLSKPMQEVQLRRDTDWCSLEIYPSGEQFDPELHFETVDGDESVVRLFEIRKDRIFPDAYEVRIKNPAPRPEPTEATIRLTGESEHTFVDETYHVRIEPYQMGNLLQKDFIHVDLNQPYKMSDFNWKIFEECIESKVTSVAFEWHLSFIYRDKLVRTVMDSEDYLATYDEFVAYRKGSYPAVLIIKPTNVSIEYDFSIVAGDP